jgi:anaerobic magnesium-protoporphyrin IX monomethyl ester cyclase
MTLAGARRRCGRRVSMVYGRNGAEVARDPEVRPADVLGLSATTGLHRTYLTWARELRAAWPEKGIFLGGPHATFYPRALEQAPLDGICLGEGEESFPEAIELWRQGFPEVQRGFWIRRDHGRGPVTTGPRRAPVRDLDGLAPAAYDLFYDDPHYEKLASRVFLATRGCPYRCTYCFNHRLNEWHHDEARFVRVRDPERVVEEILKVHRRWPMKIVWLLDANLVADKRWLEAFGPLYRRRVGLPFFCKLRAERATDRVVRTPVDAGCVSVGIGIECGTGRLRREVLGRIASDADILAGCRRLKARGIRVMSFNRLGIPGESLDDALRTLALNVDCGVDHAGATILQPYPGTALAEWAIRQGHFDGRHDALGASYFAATPFRTFSDLERRRRTNLQRLFGLAAESPEVRRHPRRLLDLPPNCVFTALFTARHQPMMRRFFYGGWERLPPAEHGQASDLVDACRELAIAPPELPGDGPRTS